MLACDSNNRKGTETVAIYCPQSFARLTQSRTHYNRTAIPHQRWQEQFTLQNTKKVDLVSKKNTCRQGVIIFIWRQVAPVMMIGEVNYPLENILQQKGKSNIYENYKVLLNVETAACFSVATNKVFGFVKKSNQLRF